MSEQAKHVGEGSAGYRVNPLREVVTDLARACLPKASWPKFSIGQDDEACRFFDEHGWVIFRGVFSSDEIARLRDLAQPHAGDILSHPSLGGGRFILDQRVAGVARALLRGEPCYFGDSTVSIDVRTMGFHKDNPDKEDATAPDWRGPYTQIRMGLYLQDHSSHSGGLAVRDRSHMTIDHAKGVPVALPTKAGDLVVWSLRTTHSGNALRARGLPRVFVPVPLARLLERRAPRLARALMLPPGAPKRLALFASFGLHDRHLQRYLRYLQTRRYAVECWQASPPSAESASLAEVAGVKLLNLHGEVRDVDVLKLNVRHVRLPVCPIPSGADR